MRAVQARLKGFGESSFPKGSNSPRSGLCPRHSTGQLRCFSGCYVFATRAREYIILHEQGVLASPPKQRTYRRAIYDHCRYIYIYCRLRFGKTVSYLQSMIYDFQKQTFFFIIGSVLTKKQIFGSCKLLQPKCLSNSAKLHPKTEGVKCGILVYFQIVV